VIAKAGVPPQLAARIRKAPVKLQMTGTFVLANVRPFGGPRTDLAIVDGRFVRPAALSDRDRGTAQPLGAAAHPNRDRSSEITIVDAEDRVALPTLVDTHIHPDKTTWGEPWVQRKPAGGIADLGRADAELFNTLPTPVGERSRRLMAHAVARGTRAMRAHADVAPAFGLAGLEGLAEARKVLSHALDVQLVAFPQHGVRVAPGTAGLLEEAAASGLADLVGGIDPTSFDGDLTGQLDLIFGIADRHRVGVDVHLHDRDEQGLAVLDAMIERTRALSLHGRVTVSHAFCLAEIDAAELDRRAVRLAELDIALTTVAPSAELVLPIRRLREHGVRVGLGSDGVRDSWSPFGNADMLHRAHLLARTTRARLDEELEAAFAAASQGSDLLGLPTSDLEPGSPADFMLVRGECVAQIVVDVPPRDVVFRAGRVVAVDGTLL
jgi:cytosine/creatinine deaminase